MGDALTESLQEFAGNPNIHFVIVTGGTPGYFNRHFSIPALIEFVEAVRASGREWPDNAAYYAGFFDKATIGPAAALIHFLVGRPPSPRDAEKKGLVHETVSGKAIDRAMEIAKRFCSHTPESLGYIKRLVRIAIDTPLAEGLALERNLFMRLCVSDQALARMRSYEARKITDRSRSLEA